MSQAGGLGDIFTLANPSGGPQIRLAQEAILLTYAINKVAVKPLPNAGSASDAPLRLTGLNLWPYIANDDYILFIVP